MKRSANRALPLFFALLSGTLFGLGLVVSGMVNPAKVLAFLDVAGNWDPTLAFVMLGALAVTTPAFRVVLKRRGPWFANRFALPTKSDLEPRLVLGAALFGIGWGLAGLCPGPAVTALVTCPERHRVVRRGHARRHPDLRLGRATSTSPALTCQRGNAKFTWTGCSLAEPCTLLRLQASRFLI